ncbi:HalOD1 output domain-containing protein [Haloplanus aerogenes]|uniref:Halobacterial output domain-containing protein n=1 Tax=Haloplanus aerogenes TaxID=660522 RepID=A0A3G8QY16_9EURY|nr:HalOD1 output domain-containing protein [Haloplanus aerogenes]AZH26661.1 hypothetical protein DU502_15330 [Haloplanus aerogenes]
MSSQCTVLHVDDDPDMLELSSDWADVHDEITWLTASDPDTGEELLSTRDIDCLVSDSFRTADGEPFVTHAADTFPDLPVVLFTSMDHDALDPEIRTSSVQYVKKSSGDPFDTLFDHVLSLADVSSSPQTAAVAPRAATRTEGRDGLQTAEHWVPIATFQPSETADLATVIVSAVEDYTDRDAAAFPPLYEHVDADALATLCYRSSGGPRDDVQVRFFYADHELAVTSDGLVLVRSD